MDQIDRLLDTNSRLEWWVMLVIIAVMAAWGLMFHWTPHGYRVNCDLWKIPTP